VSKLCARRIVLAFAMTILMGVEMSASQLRPITVQDCVRTRRVMDQEVKISPDGSLVAYVVKAPDMVSNRNDYRLYVRDLVQINKRENGRLLLRADLISGIQWVSSGKIVARMGIKKQKGDDLETRLTIVDAIDGHLDRLRLPFKFQLYSSSVDGEAIAFSVRNKAGQSDASELKTKEAEAKGFRIAFGSGSYELPEFDIYLGKRTQAGNLSLRKLCFREPVGSPSCSPLRDVRGLNLSPDGNRLLVDYSARVTPNNWKDEAIIKKASGVGTLWDTYVSGLYGIRTGEMRLAFNYGISGIHAQWLPDSKHYAVVGASPFGTEDAANEAKAAFASGEPIYYMSRFQHVFIADATTGTATNILHREERGAPGSFTLWSDFPIWISSNQMLVRVNGRALTWMENKGGEWEQRDLLDLPAALGSVSFLTSDGRKLVGVSQSTMNPPDLFLFDLKSKQATLLTDLNPEFREVQLGQVERLEWSNRYGSRSAGLLIKPVGFQPGKRYPMVFLAAYTTDDFISDAAPYATTAYAPQSLANAGFVVVLAHYPADNKVPQGEFPGEMSFAYNWMSMVESAVDLLAAKNIVDSGSVGIGGFSRTSWLTDFVVTHSTQKFVAASSADSGIYNYWTYFRSNSREDMKSDETQLGGPPYGGTLADWLKYAPPFNADRVRAAVLMEYTGTSEHGFEWFVALNRMNKAVELYRYPKGAHPLDTPFERIASLQRNVDWFRFWVKGDEDPDPVKADQYARWRELRRLQEESEAKAKAAAVN
jgi:dipeptidyl aminopeptidase/acylaminoacyl peptidase